MRILVLTCLLSLDLILNCFVFLVRQEEATVKRIKLEYDELSSCNRQLVEVWDLLVSKESRISTKCDNQMLLQAIKQGMYIIISYFTTVLSI